MSSTILSQNAMRDIFGPMDRYKEMIEGRLDVVLSYNGGSIYTTGEDNNSFRAETVIQTLANLRNDCKIELKDVLTVVNSVCDNKTTDQILELYKIDVGQFSDRKPVHPRNFAQRDFLNQLHKNTVVFAIGPAGTGKTFFSVAAAARALKNNDVKKIIITRPIVSAGEELGFLPGGVKDKVGPYMQPVYDALTRLFGSYDLQGRLNNGTIEIAPLAYMRGRTFNDSFIILDEGQNLTPEQMKMLLTRLGWNSKIVVTGDPEQSDLPKELSGLSDAIERLQDRKPIGITRYSLNDVIRNPVVAEIIRAYE